jgi:uncharacterized protein YutE (UPF0331/DUF86 family)
MPTESKFDKEKVAKIIDDVEKYLAELSQWNVDEDKVEDHKMLHASAMLIFSIMNRLIDLGNEIVSTMKLGVPSTYKDIFFMLYQKKLLTSAERENVNKLVEYRNAIAHAYYDLTPKDVLHAISLLPSIRPLMKKAKKLVA